MPSLKIPGGILPCLFWVLADFNFYYHSHVTSPSSVHVFYLVRGLGHWSLDQNPTKQRMMISSQNYRLSYFHKYPFPNKINIHRFQGFGCGHIFQRPPFNLQHTYLHVLNWQHVQIEEKKEGRKETRKGRKETRKDPTDRIIGDFFLGFLIVQMKVGHSCY